MKKIFLTLITILLILAIGLGVYFKTRNDKANTENETTSDNITTLPTEAPLPTQAPEPTVTEAPEISSTRYLVYQRMNGALKYGYIDDTGLLAIQPTFDVASDFMDGVAVVLISNQWCVIDTDGNVLFMNDNTIDEFHNGMAKFVTYDSEKTQYGYIDTTGKVIIEPQYNSASSFKEDNTAYVSFGDGKYAKIDQTGKTLESYELDTKYENAWNIEDGYIIFNDTEKNKFGVVNIKGEILFEPLYSEITYLGHDLFALKDPNLEYYFEISISPAAIYNQKGEQLTDYSIYDLSVYYGDYASATDSSSTYFLGLDGKKATNLPEFDGRGTLKLLGDVIKADIDHDLIYSRTDGTILWQSDNSYTLDNGIIISSIKFKPNKYVSVYYPQMEGLGDSGVQLTINNELKRIFTEARVALKEEDMVAVEDSFQVELIHNLLVINKNGYDYPFGAAHGMPIREYYYIDLKTGVFYELRDLFLEGSDYATKINELINFEIKLQSEDENSMLFPEFFEGISEDPSFILTEDAVTIYFYPYEIAAYAAGFPEFIIPFDDISDYLDTNGNFWNAFH